jgi:hypothetical protein
MEGKEVALAAIGLAGALAAGFFKLIGTLNITMNKVAESNEKIAQETRKAADEAEKRNGHLAELVLESQRSVIRAVQDKDQRS